MTVENEHTVLADNPYWHGDKPYVFDAERVEKLCLTAFEAFSTSTCLYDQYVDEEGDGDDEGNISAYLTHPTLIGKHRETAEGKISSALLSLAVSFRTLYDTLEEGDAVKQFVDQKFNAELLSWLSPEQKKYKTSLREVCNKIIHAKDVRYVYRTTYKQFGGKTYMMNGIVELWTDQTGKEWKVSFILPDFLEAIMDIAKCYRSITTEVS